MTRFSTTGRHRRNQRRYSVRRSRHISQPRRRRRETSWATYRNRETLLSRGEAAFFGPLTHAVAGRFLIMCKVRLADIITCSETDWHRGMGSPIAQKHLDFVLCDLHSTRFVLAIELDDRSHEQSHRRMRDRFVNQVLAEAGIQLLRFRASARYSVESIRERILTEIEREGPGRRAPAWPDTLRHRAF